MTAVAQKSLHILVSAIAQMTAVCAACWPQSHTGASTGASLVLSKVLSCADS